MLLEHKGVSKIAKLLKLKVVIPPKQFLKQEPISVSMQLKEKKLQLLDLAFVGKAFIEIFSKIKRC